jgi:peptidoglycan/LPS O-acetylase OafA/YrhL
MVDTLIMMDDDSSTALLTVPAPVRAPTRCPEFGRIAPRVPDTKLSSREPDWICRGHIPGLDGLRAFAVLMVLAVHSCQTQGFPDVPLLKSLAYQGAIGVDVFFVISGFLITTLLAREMERHGQVNLQRFYLRRFLRIIPAYVTVLAVVAICQVAGRFHLETRDWVGALTYTTNFYYHPSWELGHTWSLAVEEHFYLMWPAILFVAGFAGGWRAVISCIVGCWLLRCGIALVLPRFVSTADIGYYSAMAENWTFTRLDTISMGCLLALASRSEFWRSWLDWLTRPAWMVVWLAAIGVSLQLGRSGKFHLCVSYSLEAVCIALLIWGSLRSDGFLRRVLCNPVLTTIGVGSYSIYLWQQLFVHPRLDGWIHQYPQNVVLAMGMAWFSFWVIERPFNQLKDRVAA